MKKQVLFLLLTAFICASGVACGSSSASSSSIDTSQSSPSSVSDESTQSDSSAQAKTPYTITYHFGELENGANVSITAKTQTVYYGETFTTYKPTCSGYVFVCWKMQGETTPFQMTTYTIEDDITLIATWANALPDDDSEWTENG